MSKWVIGFLLLLSMEVFAEKKSDFSGVWNIDKGKSANISAAVNECVAKTNFIIRSIARRRLNKTNTAHERIEFSIQASSISVIYGEARKEVKAPSDGSIVPWVRDDGDLFKVSHQVVGGVLVETFRDDDGEKVIEFSLSDDAKVLTMAVTVSSPRLPKPLTYQLVYSRAR